MKIFFSATVLLVALVGGIFFFGKKNSDSDSDTAGLGDPASSELVNARWEHLQGLDYKTGLPDEKVKELLNKRVRIPGFVVPLDLQAKQATEFLLVPTYGSCIHTPPPPANQMVLVKMASGNAPKREAGPVWVEGPLELFETKTPWGQAGFLIKNAKTEPYEGGY